MRWNPEQKAWVHGCMATACLADFMALVCGQRTVWTVCTWTVPPGLLTKLWRQGLETVFFRESKLCLKITEWFTRTCTQMSRYTQHNMKKIKFKKTDAVCAWHYMYQYHNYIWHTLTYCQGIGWAGDCCLLTAPSSPSHQRSSPGSFVSLLQWPFLPPPLLLQSLDNRM